MRKAFRHTDKAVRLGEPDNRVFITVYQEGKYYTAWKCTKMRDGYLSVPWTSCSISLEEALLYAPNTRAPNGSEPTAVFKEDSLYEDITPCIPSYR